MVPRETRPRRYCLPTFSNSIAFIIISLNCIHEGALYFVEDDHTEYEEDGHEGETVAEGEPGEVALTEGRIFEGLNDGGHWVGHYDGTESIIGNHRDGIDDGGGVHPELHDEREQDGEVAVFGSHGRHQDAKAEAEACQHNYENGDESESGNVNANISSAEEEIQIEDDKQANLDAEAQQVADNGADRDYQSREIDLAEHRLIGCERVGCLVQTVGKIEPADITCHIENGLRNTVGTHLGDAAKNHHIHDDSKNRLDEIPKRTKDGLLVLYYYIALDKEFYQVTIAPDFLEIYTP